MNPRYLAYVLAHGRGTDVEAMRAADAEDWPGGSACGFILWNGQRLREWAALRGYRRTASGSNDTILGPREYADYDAWLQEYALEAAKLGVRRSRDTTQAIR